MLVTALLRNERIETTVAKAKEIRPLAEKMITLGKRGDLHARRQALSFMNDEGVVSGLFTNIAPRFAARNGGYTRIVLTRTRPGDAASMAVIELVERAKTEASEPKKTAKSWHISNFSPEDRKRQGIFPLAFFRRPDEPLQARDFRKTLKYHLCPYLL
jgi:large subunit ribosomal protein L17